MLFYLKKSKNVIQMQKKKLIFKIYGEGTVNDWMLNMLCEFSC